MVAHLTYPYSWSECPGEDTCRIGFVHLDFPAAELNGYPLEWVNVLLPDCEVDEKACVWYDSDGHFHNDKAPAVVEFGGWSRVVWFQHGKEHRDDGPAFVLRGPGGYWKKTWYQNGYIHRDDAPAEMDSDGANRWWKEGGRYRLEGPNLYFTETAYENMRIFSTQAPVELY